MFSVLDIFFRLAKTCSLKLSVEFDCFPAPDGISCIFRQHDASENQINGNGSRKHARLRYPQV